MINTVFVNPRKVYFQHNDDAGAAREKKKYSFQAYVSTLAECKQVHRPGWQKGKAAVSEGKASETRRFVNICHALTVS
jgi:hypothetical protein